MEQAPEQAFILRLPEDLADKIDAAIDDGSLSNHLSFNFLDPRKGLLKFDQDQFEASVCDLPAVIELFKTADRAAYFKSLDIGQAILVHPKDSDQASDESIPNPCPKPPILDNPPPPTSQYQTEALPYYIQEGKRTNYQLRDGITPATADIMNKAWRHFHLPEDFDLKEKEEMLLRLIFGDGIGTELDPYSLDIRQIAHIIGQQRNVLRPEDEPTRDLIDEVMQLKKKKRKQRRDDIGGARTPSQASQLADDESGED
ncbi:hypothetical protein RCL1_009057 [Eukaryota sp. TZLM3-RCL]